MSDCKEKVIAWVIILFVAFMVLGGWQMAFSGSFSDNLLIKILSFSAIAGLLLLLPEVLKVILLCGGGIGLVMMGFGDEGSDTQLFMGLVLVSVGYWRAKKKL
jgi:cytochrome b subunit of formate dehydrogenase